MITYTSILGNAAKTQYAEQLHDLAHHSQVDYLVLSSEDIQRKRLKATSTQGHECGIALAREQKLYSGAILSLRENYALIVRSRDVAWLRCVPENTAAALELGYFAGNMHWSVRFVEGALDIELKGPIADYQARLQPFIAAGRIKLVLEHAAH